MDVRWDPGIFRMLRVNFSTDVQHICEINYGKNIRRVWTTRHLTPLGKIVVFNTLAVSKLTLQSNSCINWWFCYFGSCGTVKQVKYKKLLFCNPCEDRDLNMLDVATFLASMKITSLQRTAAESNHSKLVSDINFTLSSVLK